MDDFEFRVALEAVTDETLELADRIAERAAVSKSDPELAREVANYLQLRGTMRRLRRARVAEIAG